MMESPVEYLRLRQRLGHGRYFKVAPRDRKKTALLLRLALKQIENAEKHDFIRLGERRWKIEL